MDVIINGVEYAPKNECQQIDWIKLEAKLMEIPRVARKTIYRVKDAIRDSLRDVGEDR